MLFFIEYTIVECDFIQYFIGRRVEKAIRKKTPEYFLNAIW